MKRKPITPENISAFQQAYWEAALWSTSDESARSGEYLRGENLDDTFSVDDITTECKKNGNDECLDFINANAGLLIEYVKRRSLSIYEGWELAGHDFWLTRNGHGAGFWDRGLGELGDKLSKAAKACGEVYIYAGDDNQVHGH